MSGLGEESGFEAGESWSELGVGGVIVCVCVLPPEAMMRFPEGLAEMVAPWIVIALSAGWMVWLLIMAPPEGRGVNGTVSGSGASWFDGESGAELELGVSGESALEGLFEDGEFER